jgi:hypothetical protein
MLLVISLLVITSLNTKYSCCIRVFENTDEPIVMEFMCPYQDLERCEGWFNEQGGTIIECWKYDENHVRYPLVHES